MSYAVGAQARQTADALRAAATNETFPFVVRFLSLINPMHERVATYAWSPDLGHQLRKVTYSTPPGD